MKKPLAHTKVTVKLRKSQYKEEWYLIVEALDGLLTLPLYILYN